jgi:hypothetical protein
MVVPSAIAQAMEVQRGEIVEWIVEDKTVCFFVAVKLPQRR